MKARWKAYLTFFILTILLVMIAAVYGELMVGYPGHERLARNSLNYLAGDTPQAARVQPSLAGPGQANETNDYPPPLKFAKTAYPVPYETIEYPSGMNDDP